MIMTGVDVELHFCEFSNVYLEVFVNEQLPEVGGEAGPEAGTGEGTVVVAEGGVNAEDPAHADVAAETDYEDEVDVGMDGDAGAEDGMDPQADGAAGDDGVAEGDVDGGVGAGGDTGGENLWDFVSDPDFMDQIEWRHGEVSDTFYCFRDDWVTIPEWGQPGVEIIVDPVDPEAGADAEDAEDEAASVEGDEAGGGTEGEEADGDASGEYAIDDIRYFGGVVSTHVVVGPVVKIGTGQGDALTGQDGSEQLIGLGGSDTLSGLAGGDTLDGGSGDDTLLGGGGSDQLLGGHGNDFVWGDVDNDTLDGGAGDDYLVGGLGADVYLFDQGAGRDVIDNWDDDAPGTHADKLLLGAGVEMAALRVARSGEDLVLRLFGTNDRVTVNGYFDEDGASAGAVETIEFADGTVWDVAAVKARVLTGLARGDEITGYAGADTLRGLGGRDQLDGRGGDDLLLGGAGRDTLIGGAGADTLRGGAGEDVFRFQAWTDFGGDRITDFTRGQDRIDLSLLDPALGTTGDQAFTFVTTGFGSAPGQVHYCEGVVAINTDTDEEAEYTIELVGKVPKTLSAEDFVL